MVQMAVRQEQVIDALRVEAEGLVVLLLDLVSALIQATVDEDSGARALDQMT